MTLGAVQSQKDALSAEVEGLRTTLGAAQSEKNALSAEVEGLRTTLELFGPQLHGS